MILLMGECYLKYYEANFTNKTIKENSLNIIPMKIEKESNFIDMEYIPGSNKDASPSDLWFVLITDSNSIFIYERNQLRHKLFHQFKTEMDPDSTFDSILSDSMEIGEQSDRDNIAKGEEFLRIKSNGTNVKADQPSNKGNKGNAESVMSNFQKRVMQNIKGSGDEEGEKEENG